MKDTRWTFKRIIQKQTENALASKNNKTNRQTIQQIKVHKTRRRKLIQKDRTK